MTTKKAISIGTVATLLSIAVIAVSFRDRATDEGRTSQKIDDQIAQIKVDILQVKADLVKAQQDQIEAWRVHTEENKPLKEQLRILADTVPQLVKQATANGRAVERLTALQEDQSRRQEAQAQRIEVFIKQAYDEAKWRKVKGGKPR